MRWWRSTTGHREFITLDGPMVLGGILTASGEVVPAMWEQHASQESAARSLVRRWGSTFRTDRPGPGGDQ